MSFNYKIYGLGVVSEILLEELGPVSLPESGRLIHIVVNNDKSARDVYNRDFLNRTPLGAAGEGVTNAEMAEDELGYYFIYQFRYCAIERALVYFLNKDMDRLEIINGGVLPVNYISLLLHPVMAYVACLQGLTCIHANVLERDGRAIALMGNKAAGKSTSSAILLKAGYRMLADDACVLREHGGGVQALPGQPKLKLDRETALRIFGAGHKIKTYMDYEIAPAIDKYYVNHLVCAEPTPLRAIYLVADRDPALQASRVIRMGRVESLLCLVRNLSIGKLLGDGALRRDFDFLSRLLAQVPVWQLVNPDSLELTAKSLSMGLEPDSC